jgi:site-specific recombinase XerD
MTELSQNTSRYSSPFIANSTPNMAAISDRIDGLGNLSPTKRRDLKSAVRSFCRLIGKQPIEVPANINWLHIRIRRIHPAAHDITKKRLANIKADVLKALALTGCSRERAEWQRKPTPEWQTLLDKITDKHDLWKLSQFAQYCSALDVMPIDVSDGHVTGFYETLIEETFADKPDQIAVYAVKTWNRLRTAIPAWPDIELSRPPRKKEPWTIPLNQFPPSFRDDVDLWLEHLEHPDPFEASGPMKPLRPVTIAHRRHQIQQMASALVITGHPINKITSLSVLVDLAAFKDGLRHLMSRFDNRSTEAIHGLAMGLKAIATHHAKVDEDHLNELRRICHRLNLNIDGLRIKNQQRLQQLDDPHNLGKLLHLPEALKKLSGRTALRPRKTALLMQAAIAVEILLYAPMRAGTLSGLHLDRHIRFIGSGRSRRTMISVPGKEVKNNRDLHYELGERSTRLLEQYLKDARPILLREPSDYLFPAQDGGPKRASSISNLIKETILEHTGLTINAHLFRSIAGKIHSMAAPGDFATLSHVLHNTLRTAMKSYAQFEHQSSLRHYQESVDKARKRLPSYVKTKS